MVVITLAFKFSCPGNVFNCLTVPGVSFLAFRPLDHSDALDALAGSTVLTRSCLSQRFRAVPCRFNAVYDVDSGA